MGVTRLRRACTERLRHIASITAAAASAAAAAAAAAAAGRIQSFCDTAMTVTPACLLSRRQSGRSAS